MPSCGTGSAFIIKSNDRVDASQVAGGPAQGAGVGPPVEPETVEAAAHEFAEVGSMLERAEALFSQRAKWHAFRAALAETYVLRDELKKLATDETLLCRCEDVTIGRVKEFSGWREAKLLSRCGMGAWA